MTDLDTHLRLAGALTVALSAIHLFFPRHFEWSADFAKVSMINRQMFYVHTFFLCVTLLMMGSLSFFCPSALLAKSSLGRWVAAGFTVFWLLRLVVQQWIYEDSLWRGKRFETFIHVLFTLFWTYLSSVYAWLLWHQLRP